MGGVGREVDDLQWGEGLVSGLWPMVYGLWSMVYGLWSMVYGLWPMGYGRAAIDDLERGESDGWVGTSLGTDHRSVV